MRRLLILAALTGAVTLCACDRDTPKEPPLSATLTLPDGFRFVEDDPDAQEVGVLRVGGRLVLRNTTGRRFLATITPHDAAGKPGPMGAFEVTLPARGAVVSDVFPPGVGHAHISLKTRDTVSSGFFTFDVLGADITVTRDEHGATWMEDVAFIPPEEWLPPPILGVYDPDATAPDGFEYRIGDAFVLVNQRGHRQPVTLRIESTTKEPHSTSRIEFTTTLPTRGVARLDVQGEVVAVEVAIHAVQMRPSFRGSTTLSTRIDIPSGSQRGMILQPGSRPWEYHDVVTPGTPRR
ncbi:MAG: hypothetical protein KF684_11430 [Phycisphaeraceae bacterium]|nr:hypothetical protein [Phycisphaeraceae bacterium]